MVPWLPVGFLIVGICSALGSLSPLFTGASPPLLGQVSLLFVALGRVVASVLIGWLSAQLVRAAAVALDSQTRRMESAESAERLVLSALGRVAEALERSATVAPLRSATVAPVPLPVTVPANPAAEIGRAIQEARWDLAGSLIKEYIAAHPDRPEGPRFAQELEDARTAEARRLRSKLDAAREANDPDRVLELRDALHPLHEAEDLRSLDQELTRWLMALIQKRLCAGTIQVDVVELAARVAERFDHTTEGASLHAALPTLRRSAGLCARCGKPYRGIDDACPNCLTTPSVSSFATEFDPEPETIDPSDPDRALFSEESV